MCKRRSYNFKKGRKEEGKKEEKKGEKRKKILDNERAGWSFHKTGDRVKNNNKKKKERKREKNCSTTPPREKVNSLSCIDHGANIRLKT